jgi:arabinofuranosyltransferase
LTDVTGAAKIAILYMPAAVSSQVLAPEGAGAPRIHARAAEIAVLLALASILATVVVRTAWVGDDAYITFRTIDNFLHGYGLRWNPAERVQSYTHPLWLFVLTPIIGLTGNPFLSAIGMSLVLSLCAVILALANTRQHRWLPAVVLSAMVASRSFTDYATSGLENALSHTLLAGLMLLTANPTRAPARAGAVGLLVGLTSLARLDLSLLAWPIGLAALRSPRRTLPAFALGLVPLVVWEAFSLIYYGVLFPNTAYAKLSTAIPQSDLLLQGVAYVADSLNTDPVTLFVISAATFGGLALRGRALVPALAIAAYLVYVLRIGGDFMSGRFFSAPFVISLCLFGRIPWPRSLVGSLFPIGIIVALGLAAPKPPIFSDSTYVTPWEDVLSASGVVDERGEYFQRSGWLGASGFRVEPAGLPVLLGKLEKVKATNPQSFPHTTVGLAGYYAGPDREIIDIFGLCDPLLARLPTTVPWRIGHFQRDLPAGYWESVNADRNLIENPEIRDLYETIRTVTRGPVWSVTRWKAIVALNTR